LRRTRKQPVQCRDQPLAALFGLEQRNSLRRDFTLGAQHRLLRHQPQLESLQAKFLEPLQQSQPLPVQLEIAPCRVVA